MGWCQAVIITLLPPVAEPLGVAICGFTVALEMFQVLVCFHKTHVSVSLSLPLFLTQPSVSPCVSLLPPLC